MIELSPRKQVDTALKHMKEEDDEVVKEQLNLKKLLVNASKALQVSKVEVAAISEIKKNCAILVAQGVQLPLLTKLYVTKRVATVALGAGNEDDWLLALAIGGGEEWDVKEASFSPLLAELRSVPPQDTSHRMFQEVFCDAVFSSTFLKHLNALNEEPGDATNLVRICQRFLLQCSKQADLAKAVAGEAEMVAIANVQRAMRGMLCLCTPAPVNRDTALEDAAYVVPKNATTGSIIADLPKIGRLLVAKFRTEVSKLCCKLLQQANTAFRNRRRK